jgi:hypothetical protein
MFNNGSSSNLSKLIGIGLVVLGGFFLLGQFIDIPFWQMAWPFFVIIPGLFLLAGMYTSEQVAFLAIPGSIITAVGLLLLYQSTFNHWESWAYAWALIAPTSVGIGLTLFGRRTNNSELIRSGGQVTRIGLWIFLIGGVFFELVIGISNRFMGRIGLPLLLILFGIFILFRRSSTPETFVGEAEQTVPEDIIEGTTLSEENDVEVLEE